MASVNDVALVGYSADSGTGGKSFALLLLADLAGETINITDNGWTAAGAFRTGEGMISIIIPTGLGAGTVLQVTGLGGTVAVTANGAALPTTAYTVTGSINPAVAGDQFLVYQGSVSAPTFLFALDFADDNTNYSGDATTANTTAVPTGLALGSTALAFALDNGAYTGSITGTRADILANIANPSNWSVNDSAPQSYPASFTVTSGPSTGTFAITPDATSVLEGNGGTATPTPVSYT
ncbi:MAG: hypothetical protein EOO77_38820, partial [Oxalobacteraceae bacterium]